MKSKHLGLFQMDPNWIPPSSLTALQLIPYVSTSWLLMLQPHGSDLLALSERFLLFNISVPISEDTLPDSS